MTFQERIYELLLANRRGLTFVRLQRLMPVSEKCLRAAMVRLKRRGCARSCKVAGKPLVYLAVPDCAPSDGRGRWIGAPAAHIDAGATITGSDAPA